MAKKSNKKSGKRFKIGRIVRCRRDGEEIRFKDYNGEKKTGRYAPLFSLWSSEATDDRQPLISASLETNVDLSAVDPDEEFLNLYLEDGATIEFDVDVLTAPRSGGGKKGKKPAKKAKPDEDEEDGEDEEEEDPFA